MADRKPQNNGFSGQTQTPIPALDPPQKPKRNKYAFACSILASMTSILLGYDIGVMSGAELFIKDDLKISDVQLEILMGILNVYSLLGSAATGRTSDLVGRGYTIVLTSAIFFVGAILMGFATSYAFLMVGRFVAGIGVGYALLIAPVYTAEISPATSRGFLVSFPDVFINADIYHSYFFLILYKPYMYIVGICIKLCVLEAFTSLRMAIHARSRSDSLGVLGVGGPRHAGVATVARFTRSAGRRQASSGQDLRLQRGGSAKAKVLNRELWLRLADIKEAAGILEECNNDVVQVSKRSHGEDVWKELFLHPTPTVKHILLAGLGIHFFQQTSGIDTVVLYSPKILEKADRAETVTFNQHCEYGRVPSDSRGEFDCHRSLRQETDLGCCFGDHVNPSICCLVLDWDGARHVGLQLGDFSTEIAGTRDKRGSGS
ncbi:hypothetical protein ACSBR2_001775 [Camellia fascicularis]